MKKFTSVVLLFAIFTPLFLLMWCKADLVFHHSRMKKILESCDVKWERLVMPVAEFKKAIVRSDEMIINDEWYDIKHIRQQGQSVEIIACHDSFEKELVGLIRFLFRSLSSPGQQQGQAITFLLIFTFCMIFSSCRFYVSRKHFQFISLQRPHGLYYVPDILIPPPRMRN